MAEENSELTRTAKLAQVFKEMYNRIQNYRDIHGNLIATPFMALPPKKKHPDYYRTVTEPIDMNTIHKKILTGQYKSVEAYEADFMLLFSNVEVHLLRILF